MKFWFTKGVWALKKARKTILLVANDTGIRHIAIASNTPTVGMFFGDPYRYWPRYDIHEVALPELEGPPEVAEVYAMCAKVMNKSS